MPRKQILTPSPKHFLQKAVLFFKSMSVLLAVLTVFSVSFVKPAQAQKSDIYLVEGIAAKATGESSDTAKVIANANALKDAFVTLLSRLALDTGIVNTVTDEDIFDMVSSKQITGERISANSYSAIFNVKFSRNNVERILRTKNVKEYTSPEETFLIIPVKVIERKTFDVETFNHFLLWEEENDWKQVIEKEIAQESMFQFIVPENDISNITSLNKENIDTITFENLEPLFSKYRSTEALILFFHYDDIDNKVTISVQNVKKLQKKQIRLSFVNVDRLSYHSLIEKVAEKTLHYLMNLKNRNSTKEDKNFVKIEIPISSLGEWIMIKNKIENTNLVSQLNIESLSKDYAKISINYIHDDTDIIKAFAKNNITLNRKSDNIFILSTKN